jgi:hypothetical protein
MQVAAVAAAGLIMDQSRSHDATPVVMMMIADSSQV